MKMSGTVAIVADSTHLSHRNSVHLHEISDVSKPKSLTKSASEHRRATKPLMEKRRRARINHSLNELKSLILDALHKDPSRHSKLEKADILEMTVRYLQNLQKQQTTAALATDPNVRNKFREGFTECATEVTRYVSRIDGVETGLKQRLVSHLSSCVASVATVTGSGPPPTMVNDINNNNSTPPGTSGLFAFTFPLHHHLSSSHHDQSWSLLSPSSLSPGSSVRSVSPVDSESQDMNEKAPKSNNVPIWRPF